MGAIPPLLDMLRSCTNLGKNPGLALMHISYQNTYAQVKKPPSLVVNHIALNLSKSLRQVSVE